MRSGIILFTFFLALTSLLSYGQKPDLKFKHINTMNGLSHNWVRYMIQDYKGFMWFATRDGLAKYDGYKFVTYRNRPNDVTSIGNNSIWLLFETPDSTLLIGTQEGLNIYNREKDTFFRDTTISNKEVTAITCDKENNIWVNCMGEIFVADGKTKKFQRFELSGLGGNNTKMFFDGRGNLLITGENGLYTIDKIRHERLPLPIPTKGEVKDIFEDKEKNLWIACYNTGVYKYTLGSNTTKLFRNNSKLPFNNSFLSVSEDAKGNIWLGTENGGLIILDPETEQFYTYLNSEIDVESIGSNSIYEIYKDRNDNMWLATFSGGIEFVEPRKFVHIKKNILDKNSLSSNNVSFLSEDAEGNIWIGTDGEGLDFWNRKTGNLTNYRNGSNNKNRISANIVIEILQGKDGAMWIGYWAGGMDYWDRKKNILKHYGTNSNTPSLRLTDDNVVKIYEDTRGSIWIGNRNGVEHYDRKKEIITPYYNYPGMRGFVGDILEDSYNNFWVGTYDGLTLFNRDTKESVFFRNDIQNPSSISNNTVNVIWEDSKQKLWIGTSGGLNLFNRNDNTFKVYTTKDGLPTDAIYGIVEDKNHHLWLSTSNGLSCFNPEKNTFKNYNVSDGLQGNYFNENSFTKTRSGELLFGGVNGFNIIDIDKITTNRQKPPVYLIDFKIFNETVIPGGANSPLISHITETKEIKLNYKQSVFSFDYTALNYNSQEKNQYAYRLLGLENKWNYVHDKRSATYTNLDPGEYIFKVKASNNDNVWNERGTSIKIVVLPPWWKTTWFKALVSIATILSFSAFYLIRIRVIKKQKKDLEVLVSQRTSEVVAQKEEILLQKNEISNQKDQIQVLYSDLKDSIRAAQNIQESILPSIGKIQQVLPQSFIYYSPKDVVSGDFYWFDVKNDKIIICAADCTGHGVSGAFMSINGYHLLNKVLISEDNLMAAAVLNKLNKIFSQEFQFNDKEKTTTDGMDIAVCILDKEERTLQFAGANSPLYIVRGSELIQIKGNNQSIGADINYEEKEYSNHILSLQSNDIIYMFTDGYADQLSESGSEKFMYPRFRELLINISKYPMEKQRFLLEENLIKWRGSTEQLDDILVLGFRI